jgi:transposase-like protein
MNETTSARRSRRNWSAEQRTQWLEQFERSGRSVREFCEENGLSKTTLSHWRRRAKKDAREVGRKGSPLVEVSRAQLSAVVVPGAAVRVSLAIGLEMHVSEGTDATWLGAVVRALTNTGR